MVFRSLLRSLFATSSKRNPKESGSLVRGSTLDRNLRPGKRNLRHLVQLETLEDRFNPAALFSDRFLGDSLVGPEHRGIVFIDANLVNQVPATELSGSQVVALDPNQDFFAQISGALNGQEGLDVVRLITHGQAGGIVLGNQFIDNAALQSHSDLVQSWGQSLAPGADFLVYGCNVGSGASGESFLKGLADLTGADVAGSSDVTGAGGDIILEVNFGNIENGFNSNQFQWNQINTNLAFTFTNLPQTNTFNYGVGGLFDVNTSGNTGIVTYSITGNPAGVSVNSGDGKITTAVTTVVGNYSITVQAVDDMGTGTTGDDVTITDTYTLNISKIALTITADSGIKVYGTTITPAGTEFTTSGLINADTVTSVTLTSSGFAPTATVAGSPYAIVPSAAVGTGLGNYNISYANGTQAVTPAALTVTATSGSKVYGTTVTPAGTEFTTSGLLNADTVTSVTLTSSGFAPTATVAGSPYAIVPSAAVGTGLGNYTITYTNGNQAVTPAPLTVTANNRTKVYGSTVTPLGTEFTTIGLVNTDTVTSVTFTSSGFASSATVAGSPYAIVPSAAVGTGLGNYTISYANGTQTVTKKALTLTASSGGSRIYDQTINASSLTLTVSVSGLVGGDVVTPATYVGLFNDKNVGVNKPVTITSINLTGASAGNYTWNLVASTTATITAKALTVAGTTAPSTKVYDGTTTSFIDTSSSVLSGLIGGDLVSLDKSNAVGNYNNKNVGVAKPITITGFTISGADASNYAFTQPLVGPGDITVKALTVSGITASNKVYDSTTTATINTANPIYSGLIPGDVVNFNYGSATGTFADRHVGNGKTVTLAGISTSGADKNNYSITYTNPTANITPLALTVTGLSASNKTYDATTTATITGTGTLVTPFGIDGVTLTGTATGTFATKNVGNAISVTVSGLGLGGGSPGNYTLVQPTLSANISKATLTVSGITASNKVYDGTKTATLNVASAALVTVLGSDAVTLDTASAQGTFPAKTVGTGLTVTVSGLTIGGADAGNYNLIQPTTTANITAKSLTVTGVTANDKVYDAATAASINTGSAGLTGKVAGDVVNLVTAGATGVFASANVVFSGPNVIAQNVNVNGFTLSGADAVNYTISASPHQFVASAKITPATLTVSFITAANKTYDGTKAATLDFTFATVNGAQGGDSLTGSYGSAVGTFATKNVGTGIMVTITGLAVTGTNSANYIVANATTNANIGAKNLTIAGVTANNKVYDRTFNATLDSSLALLTGVIGFDQVFLDTNNGAGTFASKTVGSGIAVAATGFSIFGVDSGNYTVSQPTGLTANITPKGLTVSGVTASNKVYDGNTTATVSGASAALVGIISGDIVTINVTGIGGSFATKTVGTGKTVTVSGITMGGADAANYSVIQPTLTADITKRSLTFSHTPGIYTKVYDQSKTASITLADDRVSGDALTTSFASATFADKNVGTGKTITITGIVVTGADLDNYTYNDTATIPGNITAKVLTVTATGIDKEYDGTTAATVTLSDDRIAGDVLTTKYTSAVFASKAVNTTPPGTAINVSGISISGTDAGNYTFNTSAATNALINKRTLTVSGAVANNKVYDQKTTATVNFSAATINGIVINGLIPEVVSLVPSNTNPTYSAQFSSASAGNNKVVTVSGLTLTGADAANYTISQPVLTANITPLGLTVTGITAANRQYDATTDATLTLGGAGLTGIIAPDSVSIDTTKAVGKFQSSHVIGVQPVTITGLKLNGADAGNYTINAPVTVNAEITKKVIPTVDISKYSTKQVYGEPAELNPVTGSPYNQAGSVFYNNKVDISNFTAKFQFQTQSITNSPADGITFVIHNSSILDSDKNPIPLTALGANGEGLGYQGIDKSVAIKVDLLNNYGEGTNSIGVYTNGANPSNPGIPSTSLSPFGLFFDNNHIFQIDLSYNGTVLDVTATDLTSRIFYKQSYTIDIPTAVGDTLTKQAYVGFTGATGALASRQSILNWEYKNGMTTTIDYTSGFNNSTNLTFNGSAVARGNPNNPTYPTYPLNPLNPISIADQLVLTCPNKAFDYSTGINGETLPILLYSTGNSPGADVGTYAMNGKYYNGTGLASDYDLQTFTGGVLTVDKRSITKTIEDQRQTYDSPANLATAINTYRPENYLNQAGSVFHGTPVSVNAAWTSEFTFQSKTLTSVGADGIAFVLQSKGAGAVGKAGEGLGYQGIQKSVAIKFDSFNNRGEGTASTGIFYGGANPSTLSGSTDLTAQGFNFANDHLYKAELSYNGSSTLTVLLTNLNTMATATQTYSVNLAGKILGNTAYVGFTSGTGSQASEQSLKSWKFNGSHSFTFTDFTDPTPLVLNGSAAWNSTAKSLVMTGNNPGQFIETGVNDEHLKLTLATAGVNVGTYALTGTAADDEMQFGYSKTGAKNTAGNHGKLANYNLTLNNGNVQIRPADLLITAPSTTINYGDTPTFVSTATGLKNGEILTSVNYSTNTSKSTGGFYRASDLDFKGNLIPWALIPSNATGTFNPANYNISYQNGDLKVNKVGLSITPQAQTKTYGDTFAFTGLEINSSGLKSGDTITAVDLTSPATVSTAAFGTYDIKSASARGNGLDNYNITYNTLSNGFTVNKKTLTVNIANKSQSFGSKAELNDLFPNPQNQVGSFFTSSKVDVSTFATSFKFKFSKVTNNVGEGFTFTIQGNAPTVLGGKSGGLGYQGIGNSIAVKFDLLDNGGEGDSSTGVYTNGAPPIPNSDPIKVVGNNGIDLQHFNDCQADITYDGNNINLKITDLFTNKFFQKSYTGYNIPALVGGKFAYVGFTGCTGTTVKQEIKSWTMTPASGSPVSFPTGFGTGAEPVGLTINGDATANWTTGFITLTDQNYGQQILGANNETLFLFLTSPGNNTGAAKGSYALIHDGKIYNGTGNLNNYNIIINSGTLTVS